MNLLLLFLAAATGILIAGWAVFCFPIQIQFTDGHTEIYQFGKFTLIRSLETGGA